MKSSRILLHSWPSADADQYLDIPWPAVHQSVAPSAIAWCNQQDTTDLQLIVEYSNNQQSLWVEFYSCAVQEEYSGRFGQLLKR
jgi:hypothetical protein